MVFLLSLRENYSIRNDDYPIVQDLVSSGVLSDKGALFMYTPKANISRINK